MIRINSFMKAASGKREALVEMALKLVEESKKERGCVAYDLYIDARDQDRMMICETWNDVESLTSHQGSRHFVEIVPRLHELAEERHLDKFEFNNK
ncbi:MAG: antibiotic biosynthesis monooxygenase [Muribaculaceae bacterium]|nr:antibiotic biosynthesis monooxygenase [Muribaculaceae bacterium]